MPCIQLVYTSEAKDGLTDLDVLDILEIAQGRNHSLKISGLLLFNGSRFMQLLEGDVGAVEGLYEAIAKDSRHQNVQLVGKFSADAPAMPTWAMAYFSDATDSPSGSAHHFVLNRTQAREICDSIHQPIGGLFWDAVNGAFPAAGMH